ncbi:MAG TPA: DNA mismatch repair protein MutS, partial [Clostridiales bacterium UBA8153]|nr:DNA mismatch repair protein MutS [Clostridiales bacterium UBA8153]
QLAAGILNITLTSREVGDGNRIPMCGVPHHAAGSYLAKLVEAGHRVAVCEQLEDPRHARGLVKREVVRVVTPGTLGAVHTQDDRSHRFMAAIAGASGRYGLAAVDVATGTFLATEFGTAGCQPLLDELSRLAPAECLVAPAIGALPAFSALAARLPMATRTWADQPGEEAAARTLKSHFRTVTLEGFGLDRLPAATCAAGGLLEHLLQTQRVDLQHLTGVSVYHTGDYVVLDETTRRNLELVRRLRDGAKHGTLLGVLDRTVTPLGARLLRSWLERPLSTLAAVQARLDAVEQLVGDARCRLRLQEVLGRCSDLERLLGRVAYATANGRDLLALATSVALASELRDGLEPGPAALLHDLRGRLDPMPELVQLLRGALVDHPPVSVGEGGLIRPGYSLEVDELRELSRSARSFIAGIEVREREETGIKSLKVGFNRVFGYYIEVTNPNLAAVPPAYVRRQTLANAERFVTEKLKEQEQLVLGAEERLGELEHRLFLELVDRTAAAAKSIQEQATVMAALDCLAGLATVAAEWGYCRPEVDQGTLIHVEDGRHPVLEQLLGSGEFVPNDVRLDTDGQRLLIITGPNMAGKSTYCRQVALMVLMAQAGSFVPARAARIGMVDRIFARVGAHDDLTLGQSTFMVEMLEVSRILNGASGHSLVILDEIGRGTSTFDGLSLAWAVAEYLHERVRARTLLATHYRELTALEGQLAGVRNYSVAVREQGQDILFLRKIVKGGADASYGIQVARLAGVPEPVLARARELLSRLERGPGSPVSAEKSPPGRGSRQLALLKPAPDPVHVALKDLEVLSLTPQQAISKLYQLQQLAREADRL